MNHQMKLFLSALILTTCATAQTGATPGSLYVSGGRLADFTRDLRATQVDDIITIVVTESLSAVSSGVTNTSRKSSATSNIAALAGAVSPAARLANPLNIAGNQQLQGQGQTTRAMTLATTISARVVEVSPNGTMTVEGVKEIGVNSEKQTITLRRPGQAHRPERRQYDFFQPGRESADQSQRQRRRRRRDPPSELPLPPAARRPSFLI